MIANALHHGKTVLFVAEKMAALEVVEKRLNKIGLGPFCLELHSNKAQKRAVLKQLEDTLNVGRVKTPAEFEAEAAKIASLRAELNDTMSEIHKVRPYGMSLYDAAVKYEQFKPYGGKFSFSQSQIDAMNAETYSNWRGELERLAAAGREFGDVTATPLTCCRLTECTPDTRGRLESRLNSYKSALAAAGAHSGELCTAAGSAGMSYAQCKAVADVIAEATADGYILPQILTGSDWELRKAAAEQLVASGRQQRALKVEVLGQFEPSVLAYDASGALVNWKTAQSKWFLPKLFGTNKLVKELAAHAKSPATVTKQNIVQHYEKLNQLGALSGAIVNAQPDLTAVFGALWQGESSDWDTIERSVALSDKLRGGLAAAPLSAEEKSHLAQSLVSGYGDPTAKQSSKAGTDKLTADFAALNNEVSALGSEFALTPDALGSEGDWSAAASAQADSIIGALPQLKEWTGIVTICNKLTELGIGNVADNFLAGKVRSNELLGGFRTFVLVKEEAALFVESGSVILLFRLGIERDLRLEQTGIAVDDRHKVLSVRITRRAEDTERAQTFILAVNLFAVKEHLCFQLIDCLNGVTVILRTVDFRFLVIFCFKRFADDAGAVIAFEHRVDLHTVHAGHRRGQDHR